MRNLNWKNWFGILVFGFFGILFVSTIWRDLTHRPVGETKYRMGRIQKALEEHKENCKAYPQSLNELKEAIGKCIKEVKLSPRLFKDAWGKNIIYQLTEEGHFSLVSLGKGGVAGGKGPSEDIVVTSAPSELELKRQAHKEKLLELQRADGFVHLKCLAKPEGAIKQSKVQVGVRRNPENLKLIGVMVWMSWSGSKAFEVEVEANKVEADGKIVRFEVFGENFSLKLDRITSVAEKFKGRFEAKVPKNPLRPSDELKDLSGTLICKSKEVELDETNGASSP